MRVSRAAEGRAGSPGEPVMPGTVGAIDCTRTGPGMPVGLVPPSPAPAAGRRTTKPDRRWSAVRGGPPRHHARSEPAHASSPRASRRRAARQADPPGGCRTESTNTASTTNCVSRNRSAVFNASRERSNWKNRCLVIPIYRCVKLLLDLWRAAPDEFIGFGASDPANCGIPQGPPNCRLWVRD